MRLELITQNIPHAEEMFMQYVRELKVFGGLHKVHYLLRKYDDRPALFLFDPLMDEQVAITMSLRKAFLNLIEERGVEAIETEGLGIIAVPHEHPWGYQTIEYYPSHLSLDYDQNTRINSAEMATALEELSQKDDAVFVGASPIDLERLEDWQVELENGSRLGRTAQEMHEHRIAIYESIQKNKGPIETTWEDGADVVCDVLEDRHLLVARNTNLKHYEKVKKSLVTKAKKAEKTQANT